MSMFRDVIRPGLTWVVSSGLFIDPDTRRGSIISLCYKFSSDALEEILISSPRLVRFTGYE